MNTQQKLSEGYQLGCIKYQENYNFYFMPIAYWILNYLKYDPSYEPEKWDFIFRNNILLVTDQNLESYLHAIEVDKISIEKVKKSEGLDMLFFIDFDNKLYVTAFDEIEMEDYLPNSDWKSTNEDPLLFLPPNYNPNL